MRLAFSAVLIGVAALALPAQGVTVRGVAFDSLNSVPLGNAFVTMSGGGKNRSATADSSGRFTFDDVAPGAYIVSMQHAAIDSLGVPGISSRANITDGKQEILIALPSFASMWRSVCGGARAPADSGFLFGVVRHATTGRGVATADIDISWIDVALDAQKHVTQKRWRRTSRADTSGAFGVCGVPAGVALRVQAMTDSSASGTIDLAPAEARVRRRDLLLGPASGDTRGTIVGYLRGDAGNPLRDARVVLEELPEVRSEQDGRFVIRNAPLGTRQIMITSVGMMPLSLSVDVVPHDTAFVDAKLYRLVATLDPVKVKASARLAAFNRDLEARKRAGFGKFIDSTKLAPIGTLSAVFGTLASTTVQRGRGANDFVVLFPAGSRQCVATVWLDGRRSDFDEIKNIDPRDLALVESYPHRVTVPSEFTPGGLRQSCGAIALWRKSAVQP